MFLYVETQVWGLVGMCQKRSFQYFLIIFEGIAADLNAYGSSGSCRAGGRVMSRGTFLQGVQVSVASRIWGSGEHAHVGAGINQRRLDEGIRRNEVTVNARYGKPFIYTGSGFLSWMRRIQWSHRLTSEVLFGMDEVL